MVKCSNNECLVGWYHAECIGVDPQTIGVIDDWWCSEACRASRNSIMCHCKKVKNDRFVTCGSGDQCKGGFKFHLTCIHHDQPPG